MSTLGQSRIGNEEPAQPSWHYTPDSWKRVLMVVIPIVVMCLLAGLALL